MLVGKTEPRAADLVRFFETHCYVPDGPKLGQKFKLADFQIDILRAIYDAPRPVRRVIISMGRKCAKTTLCALIVLAHRVGPKVRSNAAIYSTAMSREQAAILFHTAAKIVRLSPDLREYVTVRDSAKELVCSRLGTKYRALSADASTAFVDPSLVIHDELGQVRGPRSELYEALETATGAQENPLSIVISTQAPTDADLLSVLIDDALSGHDPRTVCKLYTAPVSDDPLRWRRLQRRIRRCTSS
jgi:phage terminase large subunit-like protein